MKPWVHMDKNKSSAGAAHLREHLVCIVAVRGFAFVGKCSPLGLNKCIDHYYPGLAPKAMKSVPFAGLIYVITTNQLLGRFDAVACVYQE